MADFEHDGKLWQKHHHGDASAPSSKDTDINIKTWSRQLAETNDAPGGAEELTFESEDEDSETDDILVEGVE